MSSPTWTPAELSSSARPASGRAWRIVEAQHRVSTLKLVDTPEDQAVLERLIDETKPSVPPECRHLDYLLFTPFRYGNYPYGSRFRRPGNSEGVFYASDHPKTAMAEIGFYRCFFMPSPPARRGPPTPRPTPRLRFSTPPSVPATSPGRRSPSIGACGPTSPTILTARASPTPPATPGSRRSATSPYAIPSTAPTSRCSAARRLPSVRRSPGRPGGCWCPSSAFAPCASPRAPRSPGSAPPSPPIPASPT
jgi:hypothetical protein